MAARLQAVLEFQLKFYKMTTMFILVPKARYICNFMSFQDKRNEITTEARKNFFFRSGTYRTAHLKRMIKIDDFAGSRFLFCKLSKDKLMV